VDAENSSESLEEDDDTIMDIAVSDQTATTIICVFVSYVMDTLEENNPKQPWGGSLPGKSKNVDRDFEGAFVRLKEQHFSGKSSKFNKEFF